MTAEARPRLFTERYLLHDPSMTVVTKVSVDGAFDPEQFGRAIDALTDAHPFIRATVRVDDQGEAWYDLDSAAPCEIHIKQGRSSEPGQERWLDTAQSELQRRFDWERGPLVRFFAFHDPTGFDLMIVAHHLLGDGCALVTLTRDLTRALAGLSIEP
ncbi:MAG: condensation domain-containing protein, partial [Propionibacteriaceae bacterium]|nr:condensation domain-containing protein [Propionibacteriaceae bacterium]